ncbi:hypothetical protein Tco_0819408 [Tanacetum coccineum]|uniref:Transposase (Putative), gypsy type n=1 Tax=Tanacetum coccineum TaxID=301880 RepID=A0ABQ5AB40_9ASTR
MNSKNKGWLSFSKRQGNDTVCYTKPLDSLKIQNDHFFWVDAFACPASFSWNTSKSVLKDPFSKSSEFNAEHYATLVAYPAPFHKYPKPFLCLVGISRNYTLDEDTYPQFLRKNKIDLLSVIQTADPTKVRVGERQRAEDEPRLLDTTVGRVVPLLPIALARAKSELDASVDKLFDEGVSEAAETVVEDAAPVQPRRQRKRKTIVSNAGGPSHPSKKGEPIPTLPFVTSSVSATPEREDEAHTASVTGLNLRTIGAPPRFVISSDSSHHFGANIAEAEVDSFARPSVPLMIVATTVTSTVDPATTVKEKFVESSIFGSDSSGGGADHTAGGFSDLTGSDFIVGGIRTVISPDTDLQKVYVPQWSVTNASRLDDGRTCREMVDEFAPPKFFASIHGMEHDQLFTEFNVGAARQMSLSAEVRMRVEYNIRERRRLNSVVEEKNSLLKTRDEEVKSLKTQLLVKEAEAAKAVHLLAEASKFEVVEEFLRDEVKLRLGSKKLLTWMLRLPLPSLRVTFLRIGCMNWRLPLLSFRSVKFSLIPELRANKDASIDTIMNHLRLEDTLAERLDISSSRVQKIKENIANHVSALRGVFVSLSEPLSDVALEGTEGTSGGAPGTADTTTALSIVVASTSVVRPISIDDFEVTGADDQATTDGNVVDKDADPFPNVDEAELNVSE